MKLSCTSCSKFYGLDRLFTCPNCGEILSIVYNYQAIKKKGFVDKRKSKIWRFWRLLPFKSFPRNLITLGEGDMPFIKIQALGGYFEFSNLYLKNEGKNPTGSFKDRAIAVGFNKGFQEGFRKFVVWSSGNAAISLATFAKKAKIKAKVFIEPENEMAIERCPKLGAEVVEIPDNKNLLRDLRLLFFKVFKSWEYAWQKEYLSFFKTKFKKGWYPVQPNIIVNPYQIEGNKTISYEVCEELKWAPPDVVISPGITGDLFLGQWRGYQDLYNLGIINKLPRMILVARKKKNPVSLFNSLVLRAVKDSDGEIIYTTEKENKEAQRLIFRKEKITTEAISASTIAGLEKIRKQIKRNRVIVCILSGGNILRDEEIF